MIRPLTLLTLLAASGAGLHLYKVKHEVALLDRELAQIQGQTEAAKARTGILKAEWQLLNEPERLRRNVEQYLPLDTMQPSQFIRAADIDKRLPQAVAFAGPRNLFAVPAETALAAAEAPGPDETAAHAPEAPVALASAAVAAAAAPAVRAAEAAPAARSSEPASPVKTAESPARSTSPRKTETAERPSRREAEPAPARRELARHAEPAPRVIEAVERREQAPRPVPVAARPAPVPPPRPIAPQVAEAAPIPSQGRPLYRPAMAAPPVAAPPSALGGVRCMLAPPVPLALPVPVASAATR